MLTILIIEDEIKTARELKKNIEKYLDDAVVLTVLQSIKASLQWFKENNSPDLIFSDIQLADGLSFEIFKKITVKAPIIFCTAYDEYAIEAFKTSSIDYLLKPIDEQKLKQSLEKFHQMKALFETDTVAINDKMQHLFQQLNPEYKKTILVHFQEKIIPLSTDTIAYFHHELGNVYLMTFEKKKYFVNQTLDELETQLNPNNFFRANRQHIVHRKAVVTVENYFSRRLKLMLLLPTTEEIIISKTKAPQLLSWLETT
jgi:two-component system, LytTR family, response regulator LytT